MTIVLIELWYFTNPPCIVIENSLKHITKLLPRICFNNTIQLGVKLNKNIQIKGLVSQKVSKEETLKSSRTASNVLLQIYLFV